MSDTTPPNLVLDHLRAIRGDIGLIKDDMAEIKQRLTTLEIQLGGMVGTEQSHYGQTMLRLDRFDGRLDRIERRLDLTDAPA
jgi:hypothetical protein